MEKVIQIRESIKYQPEFNRIREIATNFHNQISTTIMELVKLGLKSYDAGNRVVEDKVVNISDTFERSINREVARSVLTSLAGSLVDIERYEQSKLHPDKSTLKFYDKAGKALFHEHRFFRHYTDEEVETVIYQKIAPILKNVRQAAGNNPKREQIIEANKDVLINLIKKAGIN